MASITHEVGLAGLSKALDAFIALGRVNESEPLSIAIAVAKSSTHERLRESKTGPDGTPWAEWSDGYAATRGNHHSLLMSEGNLDDSLAEFQQGGKGGVGSNLSYAAIQQFGGEELGRDHPARPFLGISDDDARNIVGELEDWLGRKVGVKA